MDSKTSRRVRFIVLVGYFAVILALIYVVVKYALGLVFPFVVAFAVALALQGPAFRLERATGGKLKKKSAALILLAVLIVLLGVIISFAGVGIVAYVKDFVSYLRRQVASTDLGQIKATLLHYADSLNGGLKSVAVKAVNSAYNYLSDSAKVTKLLSGAAGGAWSFAKNLPSGLLAVVISIIACFFATASWDRIKAFFFAQLGPRHQELARGTKVAFRDSIGNLALAYVKIIGVTFVEVLVGFYILKLIGVYTGGFIPLIAIIIAVVDILPVLGTGTIMVPWAGYNLIVGNYGFAIGQVILYLVICVVRQFIEPKLVGSSIGLNPLVTLMAMYVGLKIFGAVGMFLLPVSIIVLKALQDTGKIHIWTSLEPEQKEDKPGLLTRLMEKVSNKKSSAETEE